MQILTTGQGIIEILQTYCKHHGKYGVYISVPELDSLSLTDSEIQNYYSELVKACPPLKENQYDLMSVAFDGSAILLYDTYEEQQDAYWSIVGDDGPTKTNPYDGPMRVYAITINKYGQTENENT